MMPKLTSNSNKTESQMDLVFNEDVCDKSSCGNKLDSVSEFVGNSCNIQIGKEPKRVLHFSDGIVEEYSSDEEEKKHKRENNAINLSLVKYLIILESF